MRVVGRAIWEFFSSKEASLLAVTLLPVRSQQRIISWRIKGLMVEEG